MIWLLFAFFCFDKCGWVCVCVPLKDGTNIAQMTASDGKVFYFRCCFAGSFLTFFFFHFSDVSCFLLSLFTVREKMSYAYSSETVIDCVLILQVLYELWLKIACLSLAKALMWKKSAKTYRINRSNRRNLSIKNDTLFAHIRVKSSEPRSTR